MDSKKKELLEKVNDLALKKSIDSCDIIFSEGNSFSVSVQNQSVDSYKVSGSQILGIRTIKDNKVGLSYTEAFDEDALNIVIDKALENSQFSRVNEHEKIDYKSPSDNIYESPKLEEVDPQKLVELAKELEAKTKAKSDKVKAVPYNGVSEGESHSYYLNSKGTFCYDNDYSLGCYTSALIKDGQKSSMHYKGVSAKKFSDLDSDKCIDESFLHAHNWLEASAIKSGKYPVIFDISQLESLFGAFQKMFSAKAQMEESNPMSDKFGKSIFHKGLSIIDSPMLESSLYKMPFDSEGHKRENLELIKDGVLSNFYHNSVTASYLKTENNFRASRGPRSALGVGGTNIMIAKGNTSDSDLYGGKYLKVMSMQGLHSGLNFMSGDFSFGASGYLMQGKDIIQPVNEITIAGNYYKMLSEIDGIGEVHYMNSSKSFVAPEIRFSNLTIAGN